MSNNMYDERGFLKTEYADSNESQKKKYINTDVEKIDSRTDFGKGIVFKSLNGGEHTSMESVEIANKAYLNSLIIDSKSHKNYSHLDKLEKAYFDCITQKFNINDKDMAQQVITTQHEKFIAYIKERYGIYLSEILEQFNYDNQNCNKSQKR